jgi:hypothetical protein
VQLVENTIWYAGNDDEAADEVDEVDDDEADDDEADDDEDGVFVAAVGRPRNSFLEDSSVLPTSHSTTGVEYCKTSTNAVATARPTRVFSAQFAFLTMVVVVFSVMLRDSECQKSWKYSYCGSDLHMMSMYLAI